MAGLRFHPFIGGGGGGGSGSSVAAPVPSFMRCGTIGLPCGTHQETLWEDLFSNPSEWWDNRLDKRSPRHPDFKHRFTREPLWLNDQNKPTWVDAKLPTLDDHSQFEGLVGACDGSQSLCDGSESLCEYGPIDRALHALLHKYQDHTVPSENVYWSLLKACSKNKALHHAKQVHAHMTFHGLESIAFLGEYLVGTLTKCGGLDDALQVFHMLPHRTDYSWTAVISGYTDLGMGSEALEMYYCMQEEGLEPNEYTFVSLLKACGAILDIDEGRTIHADTVRKGLHSDVFVGNSLVSMYGKCGSIEEAEAVFTGLLQRNVVSWNAMLTAYVEQGEGGTALQFYRKMQEDAVCPDERTFVVALQACCTLAELEEAVLVEGKWIKMKSLEIGRALHAEARAKGFNSVVYIKNMLVCMYGKCGSMVEAENVFGELPEHHVVSWNSMLSAYGEHNQEEKSLQFYRQMQVEGETPQERTFVISVQACTTLAAKQEKCIEKQVATKVIALQIGQALHVDAQRKGLDLDIIVGSAFLAMYGKCGSIVEAENVFEGLSQHDIVSWTAMLSAYVEQGQGEKALQLYRQMQEEGVDPDQQTFVVALQACCVCAEKEEPVMVERKLYKSMSLHICQALHADVKKHGLVLGAFVGSILVNIYGKCGSMAEAMNVFGGLSQSNVVSWTVFIMGFVEQGRGDKALQLFVEMQKEGVTPDDQAFMVALRACCVLAEKEEANAVGGQVVKVITLEIAKALHADCGGRGFDSDVFVGSNLVIMYGKCGNIVEAENVFCGFLQRDVALWNAMLSAYVEQCEGEKALQLYKLMQEEGVNVDVWTFTIALQAICMLAKKEDAVFVEGRLTKVMSLEIGQALHTDAQRKGFDLNGFLAGTLVSLYGKCGSIVEAESVFDDLPQHDIIAWTSMLSAYADQGQEEKALQFYTRLCEEGVTLDDTAIFCILQACSKMGNVEICRQMHLTIVFAGHDSSLLLATTLIDAYGNSAYMEDAQATFDVLPQLDVVSWNALISGYAQEGSCVRSLQSFEEMLLSGIEPDGVTFLSLLSAFNHAGLVDRGIECFESMSRDYGITPEVEHYASIIDLLGRAGDFMMAEDRLSAITVQPDMVMWLCLLGACQKHGNVELGEQVFGHALHLQPKQASAYVLLSNIHANVG